MVSLSDLVKPAIVFEETTKRRIRTIRGRREWRAKRRQYTELRDPWWCELTPPAVIISEKRSATVAKRESDMLIVAEIAGYQKPEGAKEHYYK